MTKKYDLEQRTNQTVPAHGASRGVYGQALDEIYQKTGKKLSTYGLTLPAQNPIRRATESYIISESLKNRNR